MIIVLMFLLFHFIFTISVLRLNIKLTNAPDASSEHCQWIDGREVGDSIDENGSDQTSQAHHQLSEET